MATGTERLPLLALAVLVVGTVFAPTGCVGRTGLAQNPAQRDDAERDRTSGRLPLEDRFVGEFAGLPPEVRAIAERIQSMTPDEVDRSFPRDIPGHPVRDLGSGVHIYVWEFDEGILTFCSPYQPPTFGFKSGRLVWLVRTQSPIARSILGGYEMATTPDEYNTMYWLGNLTLAGDGTYSFKESGSFPKERAKQEQNFFLDHPVGTFKVEYLWGLGPDTMLEVVAKDTTVASLTFVPQDGADRGEFLLATNGRKLSFVGKGYLEFAMDKEWRY